MGFTLVELVMVLAVMGILASLAIPVLGRVGQIRSATVLNRVVVHLRTMQARAMSTHRRTWVVFNATANLYQAYIEDPDTPGKANRIAAIDPLTQDALSVQLDEGFFAGVDLTAVDFNGGAEIGFDNLGVPYDIAEVALTAQGSLSFSGGDVVTVDPQTGYVATGP